MANYPQELAQDAVCQSHTVHMTGLWFLPARPLRLNTNEWKNEFYLYELWSVRLLRFFSKDCWWCSTAKFQKRHPYFYPRHVCSSPTRAVMPGRRIIWTCSGSCWWCSLISCSQLALDWVRPPLQLTSHCCMRSWKRLRVRSSWCLAWSLIRSIKVWLISRLFWTYRSNGVQE